MFFKIRLCFLFFCYQNTQSVSAPDLQVLENKITGKKFLCRRMYQEIFKVLGFFFLPFPLKNYFNVNCIFLKKELVLKRKNLISDFQKALKIRWAIKPQRYCSCRMEEWLHLEMLLTNKCICSGNTDVGSLFSKEQESKRTTLHGDSAAWKQLQSCLKMKSRVCQPEKHLSQRILQ